MRIRQVKPAFWTDEVTARLIDPEDSGLFYIGLWMQADDAGYLRWRPSEIAAELYPYRPVEERELAVLRHKIRLEELGRLRVFKCGHGVIPNLPDHQRLAGPTHRVYTVRDEHARCHPRSPAGPRPVRLGQVRLGNGAGAREESSNGVSPAPEQIRANRELVNSPVKAVARAASKWLREHGLEDE